VNVNVSIILNALIRYMSHGEANRIEDIENATVTRPVNVELFCLKFLKTKTIIFSSKERKSRKSDKEVCD
jgi:hypothetical protein